MKISFSINIRILSITNKDKLTSDINESATKPVKYIGNIQTNVSISNRNYESGSSKMLLIGVN